ncbi:MAG: MYXO-CTERM sorting domain-containing protein [Myxococcota bacterium]
MGLLLLPGVAFAGGPEPFEFEPAGALLDGSGSGATDETVYAPGMRFPMEEGPAYANSQVYMHGGYLGPGGGQCDAANYSYPWRDNYCEIRSWNMPLCPSGEGHQGQDIRPGTCDDGVHWNVSTVDGTVTNIGSYSVYVTGADGTRFDFLHGTGNVVGSGQSVARAERINRVSNEFGGTSTTIHTHFNIKQDVAGLGFIFVSPYMSLVTSYQELFGLVGGAGSGALESTDCMAIEGWAWDDSNPDVPVDVQLAFGGPLDGTNPVVQVSADVHREDLCESLGSCEHAFSVEAPLSLRDGQAHEIYAYGVVGGRSTEELEDSPLSFQCEPPAVPEGVRRLIASPEIVSAWNIEPFWDVATIDDATIAGIDEDREFPSQPKLVVADDDPDTVWMMDPGYRRRVDSEDVAAAWGLSFADAETWPASVLEDVAVGSPVRAERFLLRGSDGVLYAMDDAQCPLDEDGQVDPDCQAAGDDGADDGDGGDGGGDGAGDDGDGGGADGGGSDGTAGDDGALPDASDLDEGGCGCRSTPSTPAWTMLLFGLLFARRRRR